MTITKFGHSCLLVEEGNARILIDPGVWSSGFASLTNLSAVLLTHEHHDHTDVSNLKKVLANNPEAVIFTNSGVGGVLDAAAIPYQQIAEGSAWQVAGVDIAVYGKDHAIIYPTMPLVQNSGYFIGGKLFCTGDALFRPPVPVEVLALPVCAPWLLLASAIDFAKTIKPALCFPVHDGMLKQVGPFHRLPERELTADGIEWFVPENGTAFSI